MYLHLQATEGSEVADAFLLGLRLDREFLADETRLVPFALWHAALVRFAARCGRDAIPNTVRAVVHPENLGVWTPVLRGATGVADAFRQLDRFAGDQAWTERWTTSDAGPGRWRGSLQTSADEPDGLCALARKAELSAVPILFGLSPAQVRMTAPARADGRELEFEVTWREPSTRRPVLAGAITGVGALGVGAAWMSPASSVALVAGAGGLVGALSGFLVARELARRIDSAAQLTRIRALERAAMLREAQANGSAGFVLQSGSIIAGQFRLTEQLGGGANGTIWEAERLSDGTVVALKLLRAAVAHDGLAADRLRREAAALGLAWHPNVVEVYEDGHLPDGTSYLVMERLYGHSLEQHLRRHGPLTPEEALPIMLETVDALAAVHAAGIVHRDVKPSNLFLARDPDGPADAPVRVKLLDFGIARVEWAETRLTNAETALGTPGYRSPEQEQGFEVDARTDIYGLGAVLYECLTGKPPPLTGGPPVVGPPEEAAFPASGVQPALRAVPSEWRAIIERAMAHEARNRYPDCKALREALLAAAAAHRASA
nr:MAG: hypothetical protein DIU78_16385 [Pseudomonadota bacterium]